MENSFEKMVQMARDAYIAVMGAAKWNSLSDTQKVDAIRAIWEPAARSYGMSFNRT